MAPNKKMEARKTKSKKKIRPSNLLTEALDVKGVTN